MRWEWGAARGNRTAILYGRIQVGEAEAPSLFVALVDSLGVRQVFRAPEIAYAGALRAGEVLAPERFSFSATQGGDTLTLAASLVAARASATGPTDEPTRWFLQMRGRWRMEAVLAGRAVADSGWGFFETWKVGE